MNLINELDELHNEISQKIKTCDICGDKFYTDDYGWYGEYDNQFMCYSCYDSY